ncbi:unnamed protein product [Mytilus coruscus]|uniref:TNFR-Cys domain-containing protein n=1 Tax=Mytilus coruscus TaxID=42192 RepID=A0A6J8DFF0_MYTCO|nr:unnamed protein product [Mytilus coruscus]
MFTDTDCIECNSGYTYSASDSYESCIRCTENCPNGTHIEYPCNRTNNIVCEKEKDEIVDWPKLFGYCSAQGILLPDWESFIRLLCRESDISEQGARIVAIVKESYDKDKFDTRIYNAMNLWKQKNDTGDDIKMFNTFAWLFVIIKLLLEK